VKITINKIDFDVQPVAPAMRGILLADPVIAQGVARDVWAWDHASQSGAPLTAMADGKAVPLGNGLLFYVPKVGANGTTGRAEGPSAKMAERMLAAVGAKSMQDLLLALNRILHLPQKTIPFETFAPLNPVASYTVRMTVDYAVLQLSNPGRALSGYLVVPGACGFAARVTGTSDQAALDALLAATPALTGAGPIFIVPPRTRANLGLRTLSCGQALGALQDEIRAAGGPESASDDQKRRLALLAAEWRVLRQTDAALRTPSQGARTAPAPLLRN
jgi:hypothetical protein